MTSVVEICNLALSEIRSRGINSLDEASTQAQQCKLLYPITRDMLISDHPWGFATRISPLALRADVDVFDWSYAYQYPSDCLRVERLILNIESHPNNQGSFYRCPGQDPNIYMPDTGRQVPYKIANSGGDRIIVSNDSDLRAEYRVKVEDVSLFPSTFTVALSYLLASRLAIPIVGGELGKSMRADALQLYSAYIKEAAAADMNESFTPQAESDYILARR